MDEDLRRIAVDNVSNRRKSGIISIITAVVSLGFFIAALTADFQEMYWIIATVATFVIGFAFAFSFEKKIIGRKTAVDLELERLKALYPEEKVELPKMDADELKLREILRNNRDDHI